MVEDHERGSLRAAFTSQEMTDYLRGVSERLLDGVKSSVRLPRVVSGGLERVASLFLLRALEVLEHQALQEASERNAEEDGATEERLRFTAAWLRRVGDEMRSRGDGDSSGE